MASSAKTYFLLFLVLTITLSSHQILARDSQFFNKVPSSNNDNGVTEFAEPNKQQQQQQQQPLNKLAEEEPNFIPENENNNGYGLYGHESGQLPPSTTNDNGVRDNFPANAKYLPKNYNTEAYVTEPEGYTPTTTTVPENNHNNYNPFSIPNSKYLPKNYNTESYVTEPEGYTPTTATQEYHNENNNQNYYNNGYQNDDQRQEYANNNYYSNGNRQQQSYNTGASNNYNSFAQRDYTTSAAGGNNNYDHYTNVGVNSNNGYQRQGMSDTRFLENGKYFHDINLEKSTFNPNDVNTREFGYNKNNNYYDHYTNGGVNSNNGYQKQGMSDTRFLENGKYFHDINLEKSTFNPNDVNTREFGYNNNNNMNNYEYNNDQNYAGFQNNHNQFQNFQDVEEDMP